MPAQSGSPRRRLLCEVGTKSPSAPGAVPRWENAMEVLGWVAGTLFIFAMLAVLAVGLEVGDHGEDAP
jgi:hypothetical protein